jgi:adenylate kinase
MVLHEIIKRRESKNSRAKDLKKSARVQTEIEANRNLWVDLATLSQMKQYNSQAHSTDKSLWVS